MSQVPLNERLWNSLVVQAKAKFRKWPSLPASQWVHQQYVHHGGRFADGKAVTAAKRRRAAAQKAHESKSRHRKGDDD